MISSLPSGGEPCTSKMSSSQEPGEKQLHFLLFPKKLRFGVEFLKFPKVSRAFRAVESAHLQVEHCRIGTMHSSCDRNISVFAISSSVLRERGVNTLPSSFVLHRLAYRCLRKALFKRWHF